MSNKMSAQPTEQDDPFAGPIYKPKQACLVLKEKTFTDWIIECDKAKFHVHRISLYYKSDFFRAAMDNNFKEKQKGTLRIGEAKPKTVGAVILYCYTGEIVPSGLQQAWSNIFPANANPNDAYDNIRDTCDLYQLADRLLLKHLKILAAEQFVNDWKAALATAKEAPKARTTLEACYESLPEGDLLRSTLTVAVFQERKKNDALFKVARKFDRHTLFALTVSSQYHDSWIGTTHTMQRFLNGENGA